MISKIFKGSDGFTLVELMVTTVILGIIVSAGLSLYLTQQKQWQVQKQVADMQQNVRVSMDELTRNLRMAGCGDFPFGLDCILSANADPDSLILRQNLDDCHITVETDTQPNLIQTSQEVECFDPGGRAFIWDDAGQWEWFTVDRVDTNEEEGWYEIYTADNLTNSYHANDHPQVMVMEEAKYYIDQTTDAAHPALMRSTDGLPAQVFAESIEDLQVIYLMKDGSATPSPGSLQDVRVIQIQLRARTERQDPDWTDQEYGDGYRRRTLISWVDVRNLGI